MTLVSLLSLTFSGWMAWTLYSSAREKPLRGFADWVSAAWVAAGSLAGILTAIMAVLR